MKRTLVGIYEISFKSVTLTYLRKIQPIHCTFYCNLISSYELDVNGALKRNYSPLKVFVLDGDAGKIDLKDLDPSPVHKFSDVSVVKCWISDFQNRKVDVEISVFCAYRKSPNVC